MNNIFIFLTAILLLSGQEKLIEKLNCAIANDNNDLFNALLSTRSDLNLCTR